MIGNFARALGPFVHKLLFDKRTRTLRRYRTSRAKNVLVVNEEVCANLKLAAKPATSFDAGSTKPLDEYRFTVTAAERELMGKARKKFGRSVFLLVCGSKLAVPVDVDQVERFARVRAAAGANDKVLTLVALVSRRASTRLGVNALRQKGHLLHEVRVPRRAFPHGILK